MTEHVYVIGGGASLTDFDWGQLSGHRTIGCNSAFVLGPDLCQTVVFGDVSWWEAIGRRGLPFYEHERADWRKRGRAGLSAYGGEAVACMSRNRLSQIAEPWVTKVPRQWEPGLSPGPELGWNGNTGSLALNLALVRGARRVYLLGFDMELGPDGRQNWHNLRHRPSSASPLASIRRGFRAVAASLPLVFPGAEVIQVNDCLGLSFDGADVFPREAVSEHFRVRSWA